MSPSPASGETTPPKKNGQNPSTADAEPARFRPQFIASALAVGKINPVKSSIIKKHAATIKTGARKFSAQATKMLAVNSPKTPVFKALASCKKLAHRAPITSPAPFAAKQKLYAIA